MAAVPPAQLVETLSRAGEAADRVKALLAHYSDIPAPTTEHLELAQSWCQALECLQMLVGDAADQFEIRP